MFIDFVPTFYIPISCVAVTLNDECRAMVTGRGRFLHFLRKYRFFFDVKVPEFGVAEVRLREDVNHPKRGAANERFVLTDVGDKSTYTVKPEFVMSLDAVDAVSESVPVKPISAPPAVHVHMEERVPVVDRLQSLIPTTFQPLETVEEGIPEDVLFHPYFDCQGGLPSIASKFPELFQVVDGMIRQRPPHLAPLATAEYTFEQSPLPEIAAKVKAVVCATDIPQWASLTGLYETLTAEQKRQIKTHFKSFAGFVRAHGGSLSLSNDTLKVAYWIPPKRRGGKGANTSSPPPSTTASAPQATEKGLEENVSNDTTAAVRRVYTLTHVLNELFDRFPPNKALNLVETLALIPEDMRASLPKRTLQWLSSNRNYFVVDDDQQSNPLLVRIRRATETVPLDIALSLYPHIPEEGIAVPRLREVVPESTRELIDRMQIPNIVASLHEWLELIDGDLFRKKSESELEHALQTEESKLAKLEDAAEDDGQGPADQPQTSTRSGRYQEPIRFEGSLATASRTNVRR